MLFAVCSLAHARACAASHHLQRESLTNVKFIQTLLDVIGEAGADGGCARTQGNLLYTVATKVGCLSCVLFVLR